MQAAKSVQADGRGELHSQKFDGQFRGLGFFGADHSEAGLPKT